MKGKHISSCGNGCAPRPKFIGALKKKPQEKLSEQLQNYILGNLIKVIMAFGSLVGGLLILSYLVSEHYFPPDMTMSSIGTLLAAAAITGIFITLFLALYLVFPGIMYRYVLNNKSELRQPDLLSDRAILWLLDIPSFVVFEIFVVVLFQPNDSHFACLLGALPLCILMVYGSPKKQKIIQQIDDRFKCIRLLKWESIIFIVVPGILASLPWLITLLLIAGYARSTSDESLVWFTFFAICFSAIFANHVIAGAKKFEWIVAPILLFVILIITQQVSLIPHAVVRTLALGNIENVTLLLDEQGCQIATQYANIAQIDDAKTASVAKSEKGSNEDSNKLIQQKPAACSLSPVKLLWRIGNEYFVDANQSQLYVPLIEKTGKNGNAVATDGVHQRRASVDVSAAKVASQLLTLKSKFVIPSSHVLSWSVAEQKKSSVQ